MDPIPVIVTLGDNANSIRNLVYSYYTTFAGWGVQILAKWVGAGLGAVQKLRRFWSSRVMFFHAWYSDVAPILEIMSCGITSQAVACTNGFIGIHKLFRNFNLFLYSPHDLQVIPVYVLGPQGHSIVKKLTCLKQGEDFWSVTWAYGPGTVPAPPVQMSHNRSSP